MGARNNQKNTSIPAATKDNWSGKDRATRDRRNAFGEYEEAMRYVTNNQV
jgi:hypothetical protein